MIPWERGQFYKAYENVLGQYIVKSTLEHIKLPSLLDIACGNGLITSQLAGPFNRVVGLDASSAHIKKAKESYPDIEFVHALAEEYESEEKFSTVTVLNLLEHVIDPVGLLKTLTNYLAKDGVLIVNVPNALAVNRRIAKLMGSLESEYELSPFDINIAGHRRSYDMNLFTKEIKDARSRVIHCGGVFYKMLSSPQLNWLLEEGPWEEGGFGWGRVGAEKSKDWRQAFCNACYEYGNDHPGECGSDPRGTRHLK